MKINKLNLQYKVDIFRIMENRVFAFTSFDKQISDLLTIGEEYQNIINVFQFELDTMDIKKYYTDEIRNEWEKTIFIWDRKIKIEKIKKNIQKYLEIPK